MNWFEVDKAGLARVLERRGKAWVVLELLQNAWDEDVTAVDVTLERPPGDRCVRLRVQDDSPNGFADLAHAFTLFAPSAKQAEPSQRGRFNLGEKLVLALCEHAAIRSTRGTVRFDRHGRHRSRKCTEKGTVFEGVLRMTRDEQAEAIAAVWQSLAPTGVVTRINGSALPERALVAETAATLPTEVAVPGGALRRRERRTALRLFRPLEGERATLYEMGIPVMPTGDTYHVDVQQKIPLPLDRDGVSPAYLRAVRTAVLNATYESLPDDDATRPWVREALADRRCRPEAVRKAIEARFGTRAVAYDPGDTEANKIAVSKGYSVVHGGHLAKDEWANVRAAGALPPAGQITPSPKAFSDDPDAPQLKTVDPSSWSGDERVRVQGIRRVARTLIDTDIVVRIADDDGWRFDAAYGGGELILNRARLGPDWFRGPLTERVLALVIHELGHHYAADHLSASYHEALCRLGARLGLSGPWGASAGLPVIGSETSRGSTVSAPR